ncbi:YdcF family protein [Pseudoalteromonas sp. MMG013]|uniref:ElyC/SanA/YdcF family protein n=1 Tax=unclassified Pseudoalteromonas TaxID=194690 RepID=UPI001B39C40C|nr:MULTISPECIES: ElyC/SanA/YdcF family protein [unclassified Pseudoalteromonas]MBQ4845770.1 YdcF family protein [Pseudoalteromonas sp. MMG005]MBQ4861720.1 YdcF family protein [Pseudoalteromonas sp. MMG013]
MFELKNIIGSLLMPLPFTLLLIAFCLFFINKTHIKSYLTCWVLILSLWSISTPHIAALIITPQEKALKPFKLSQYAHLDKIVVLGCGAYPNSQLPSNTQLNGCALARLVEGLRLAKHYPRAELIVSGVHSNTTLMSKAAISLGVKANRIKQSPKALDTKDEARLLAPHLVDRQVALVTSASHMARAIDLFQAQGVSVITAPTQFYSFSKHTSSRQFIAQASVLHAVTTHCHEWLGKLWISLIRALDPEAL